MIEIGKIAAIAVTGAICAVVVKKHAPEVALVLSLAAGAALLALTLEAIESARGLMDQLSAAAGLSPAVVAPVIKTVGVALLTRITAEVCRDAGEGGIAAFAETAGAAAALFTAVPLLQAVLETVIGLL
mgnify:CR=1 FL=1